MPTIERLCESQGQPSRQCGLSWIDVLWQNARDAVRALVRFPAVSVLVILTLGIGIGANAATFSVVYNVLLLPLPFTNHEQIVFLARGSDSAPGTGCWFSLGRVEVTCPP